jgi:uncharacterized protein (DUF58 family)
MDTRELLRKITALPITARGLAEDLQAGSFSSVFRGSGLEFDEVRHYQAGDDARSIDWNASARFGTPFVKMYREERELTIMILLDTSASMRRGVFANPAGGGDSLNPYEQGLLAAALIAFSAERTGQRVGALFFDREIERVFPPRKGRHHIMALVSGALQYQSRRIRGAAGGSNLALALAGTRRFLKRRGMVAVISDFFSVNWEQELCDLSRAHDVIALRISDPLDGDLADLGLVTMEDPETGLRMEAPTGFASFRESWLQWHHERSELWAGLCRRAGAAHLELSTAEDAAAVLFRFFESGGKTAGSRRGARKSALVRER